MTQPSVLRDSTRGERWIERFEFARFRGPVADFSPFLPEPNHPHYFEILCALIRIDLELGWEQAQPTPLATYQEQFPNLFRIPEHRQILAFEEFRQRQVHGDRPDIQAYQQHYCVDTHDWIEPEPGGAACLSWSEGTKPSMEASRSLLGRRTPSGVFTRTFMLLAGAVLLLLIVGSIVWQRHLQNHEAVTAFRKFVEQKTQLELVLHSAFLDAAQQQHAVARAHTLLAAYEVFGRRRWQQSARVTRLSTQDQQALCTGVGELLLQLSEWELRQAKAEPTSPPNRQARARAFHQQARETYRPGLAPPALDQQAKQLGLPVQTACSGGQTAVRVLRRAQDWYCAATRAYIRGYDAKAREYAREAVQRDPARLTAWFILGNAALRAENFAEAEAAFSRCLALATHRGLVRFARGYARLCNQDYSGAIQDFTVVLEGDPVNIDAMIHRALAYHGRREYAQALTDLETALEQGTSQTRPYFVLAAIYRAQGDHRAADRVRAEGRRRRPTDPASWLARGLDSAREDPEAALADFAAALRLDPTSRRALRSQSQVLSKRLKRLPEALQTLDRFIELYPEDAWAFTERAMLHARLGQRQAALKDAGMALRGQPEPEVLYRMAGVYAQTCAQVPTDRAQAYRLLRTALVRGYGWQHFVEDASFQRLRNDQEFQAICQAAQALR